MVNLGKIVKYLNQYLSVEEVEDDCWNGLQVEGQSKIKKIAFAVDASTDIFVKAAQNNADLIIVHHGHFWKSANPSLSDWAKERIRVLIENKISLYACHLPLDRHRIVGNNAQLLKLLGAKIKDEFLSVAGRNIGWIGELKQFVSIQEVSDLLDAQLGSRCTVLPFGKKRIRTVAICSGSGGYKGFYEAMSKEVDLYITGDSIEIYSTAKDAKLNIIFAGHYETEKNGLKALSHFLKKAFKVETIFIERPV